MDTQIPEGSVHPFEGGYRAVFNRAIHSIRFDQEAEAVDWLIIVALCESMAKEISADIAEGIIPTSISSFSELHDYVDANEYGLGIITASDDEHALFNEASDKISEWLAVGHPFGYEF